MEERKKKSDFEEAEKRKRLEIVSVKQKSWELLRICKEIIGEQGTGWEMGRMRSLQRRVEKSEEDEKKARFERI